jgi:LPXTG-motif cell wall-anchored protein
MWRGTLTPRPTVPSRGVPARRRITALAATLAVAGAPGIALAQNGAGDEQYSDPFQTTPAPKATTKPKPTPVQPVPHQQVQSQQEPEPQPTATATQTGGGGELPRTGLDLAPLALAGVALVAAGLLLRRRAGHGSD